MNRKMKPTDAMSVKENFFFWLVFIGLIALVYFAPTPDPKLVGQIDIRQGEQYGKL